MKHSRLTRQIEDTIENFDGEDPVARQYVPDERELRVLAEEDPDPIGDEAHSPVKGIVHRYPDRVLLKITDTCAVYCRFCFRKEMVGKGEGVLSDTELKAALAYIRNTPDIREVILTGGDPLVLSVRRLKELFAKLEEIPHLDIIRIHSRAPVVEPERVTDDLLELFETCGKALYLVLHINHAQEINDAVKDALKALNKTGTVLLSQSVLLKDINNNAETLETLFRTLIANRVKPYYLHHPDMAPGTSHFRVSVTEGQKLMLQLQGRLSGLAQPRYVLDIPGGHGKVPINPCYLEELKSGQYNIKDYKGQDHIYPPQSQGEKA